MSEELVLSGSSAGAKGVGGESGGNRRGWLSGRVLVLVVSGLAVLICGGAGFGQDAERADQASELFERTGELTETASAAVGTVKEFFQDGRVQLGIVLVLVILGLTLWLLGARAGRLLFALLIGTGSIIPGVILAEFLALPLWPGALVGGLLGMLVGVFIFKMGIMMVGMCISTVLATGVFVVVAIDGGDRAKLADAIQEWLVQADQKPISYATEEREGEILRASVEGDVDIQGGSLGEIAVQLAEKYRGGLLVAVVAGLAGGLLLQLFARQFMLVLTTSFMGTSMVLGGVWQWLAFEEKKVDELLSLTPATALVVFLVMLGLGMLVQLTMTHKRGEVEEEEEAEEEED